MNSLIIHIQNNTKCQTETLGSQFSCSFFIHSDIPCTDQATTIYYKSNFNIGNKLDSVRWFSHQRSPSPRAARNGIVCCCVVRTA